MSIKVNKNCIRDTLYFLFDAQKSLHHHNLNVDKELRFDGFYHLLYLIFPPIARIYFQLLTFSFDSENKLWMINSNEKFALLSVIFDESENTHNNYTTIFTFAHYRHMPIC